MRRGRRAAGVFYGVSGAIVCVGVGIALLANGYVLPSVIGIVGLFFAIWFVRTLPR